MKQTLFKNFVFFSLILPIMAGFGIWTYGMAEIDTGITSFVATHQALVGWSLLILSLLGLRLWYKRNVW